MVGQRTRVGVRTAWLTVATAMLVGALAAGCSKSASTTATGSSSTTTKPGAGAATPAFSRGLKLTLEPPGKPNAVAIPAGFAACAWSKLTPAGRAAISGVTSSSKVPGNTIVYVIRAGVPCGRAFVLSTLVKSLADPTAGLPVSLGQATCASQKAMAALGRLDPTKVSTNTDDNQAIRAMYSSLDGCAPYEATIDALLRREITTATPAQIACANAKMTVTSWSAMAAGGQTAFEQDLENALKGCGLG